MIFKTTAYAHFSKGQKPLQVAIVLNIGQEEATEYYRECWKLTRLDKFNSIRRDRRYRVAKNG